MAEKPCNVGKSYVQKMIHDGFTCMVLSTGVKLRLIDHLLDNLTNKWFTADELARGTNLRERYVREWLCAMAAGGLLDTQPDGVQFMLTPDTAQQLKQCSFELKFLEFAGDFWQAAEKVDQCFRPGGPTGTSYDDYTRFHQMMGAISSFRHSNAFLTTYIPLFEGLKEKLESGIKVLDIGCGIGLPSRVLAKHFPKSDFYGIDFSKEAIETARRHANADEPANVHFAVMNAEHLSDEWTDGFDVVTMFDAFHDQAYPDKCLLEVHRILKQNGMIILYDVRASSNVHEDIQNEDMTRAQMMYTMSLFHCMPVSLYFPMGLGLGAMVGSRVEMKMITDAGFRDVKKIPLAKEVFNDFYVAFK